MSACHDRENADYYRYTSGRWLWEEDARLRERYKRFNVAELKKIAAKTLGAETCVSIMSKLAEGGFNKIFQLVMDDGSVATARIPNLNVGPPFRITASEVATMNFARTVLKIPVPKVLFWSGEAENPVESEYILMEEATSIQLGKIWDEMELYYKLKNVDGIVASDYGNLSFADDAFPGCEKAEVAGSLPQSFKDMVENRSVIDPTVDRGFWHRERAAMDLDRDPWKRAQDCPRGINQREIAWIGNHAVRKPSGGLLVTSEAQRNPDTTVLPSDFLSAI